MSRPRPSRPSRPVPRERRRPRAESRERTRQRPLVEPLEDRRLLSSTPELIRINTVSNVGSSPANLVAANEILFFTANDGTNGMELWKSDGTAAGTAVVKDIVPGSGGSVPSNLTNVGGTLFFTASDGTAGTELWTSDGTAAGTIVVKDIFPGPGGSSPSLLT